MSFWGKLTAQASSLGNQAAAGYSDFANSKLVSDVGTRVKKTAADVSSGVSSAANEVKSSAKYGDLMSYVQKSMVNAHHEYHKRNTLLEPYFQEHYAGTLLTVLVFQLRTYNILTYLHHTRMVTSTSESSAFTTRRIE
jgi:hypothetical protein